MKYLLLKKLMLSSAALLLFSCASALTAGPSASEPEVSESSASEPLQQCRSCPEIISHLTQDQMLEIMKEQGFDVFPIGDRSLVWNYNNYQLNIVLNVSGTIIQINSFWTPAQFSNLSLEKLNEWNRTASLGRVYLDDDGDLVPELTLDMTKGVTKERLLDFITDYPLEVLGSAMVAFR